MKKYIIILALLISAVVYGATGDPIIVPGDTEITTLGTITTGAWNATPIDDDYISSAATWNAKQDALVSGTNIKTINGISVLGVGNIVVTGSGEGGGDVTGPEGATDGNVVLFDGATGKVIKDSGLTVSGSNTGDESQTTIKTKLGVTTGAAVDTGTDDTNYVTAKAIADSTYVPHVAPGDSGNVMQSDGSGWVSAPLSGVLDVITGTTVVLGKATTERTTTQTDYTKLKDITINKTGTVYVSFAIKTPFTNYYHYAQIYVNGVAAGTERSCKTDCYSSYKTYTENIVITSGDEVQIYAKTANAGEATYIKDFYVYCNDPNISVVNID